MDEFEKELDEAAALGALMGVSSYLMEAIGHVDANRWSTEWVAKTNAENLETVRQRIAAAVAYIRDHQ